MKKPNGYVIWSGKSSFNGEQIVVIMTGFARQSANAKTKGVVQTFILPKNKNPFYAWAEKKDKCICGDCLHREWGTCYVNKAQSPNGVWKAYKRGTYPKVDAKALSFLNDKIVRIGSFGDPGAVPFSVWEKIANNSKKVIGYSHAWRYCDQRLKKYCMASVENENGQKFATEKGWRTFRVRVPSESVLKSEIICPASNEAKNKTNCVKCSFCSGASNKKNVAIIFHGHPGIVRRFANFKKLMKNKRKYRIL